MNERKKQILQHRIGTYTQTNAYNEMDNNNTIEN